MRKIRVMVVDDSVVFRRLVSDELASDPMIEVVGTAPNGRIALQKLPQLSPDLVILDIEMPELNGLDALSELRKTYPRLPVIMFSSLTERGAYETLEALARGATDYFAKPTNLGGLDASLQVIRDELIPEIKAICERTLAPQSPPPAAVPPISRITNAASRIDIIAIAASTGGPNALSALFSGIPANIGVPIVIVQHMPPMFTRLLAERLSSQNPVKIDEGQPGGVLRPGHGWIAPGDFHMILARDGVQSRVLLHQDPPENSCRPAADVLFRSVAQHYGNSVLGVVMTGMGQDGLRGCEAIKAAGGTVIAQDEATSVVWGMPGYVVKAGLADRVLPLSLLAPEIVRRLRAGRGER